MRRLLLAIPVMVALLTACNTRIYDDRNAELVYFDWGVANDTRTFGVHDSLYYLMNPIGNFADSLYYNGNYTDTYYRADSLRVTLGYTTADSIFMNFDRMYATQANPMEMIVTMKEVSDTTARACTLRMKRSLNDGNIYSCGPDSTFTQLLTSGVLMKGTATNAATESEPEGSQNYEFELNAIGFLEAITQARGLNETDN